MTPLRLLFVHAPAAGVWRVGFDLAQAAAALDVPVELAFAGAGLQLIRIAEGDARAASAAAFASLELLGVEGVIAPAVDQEPAGWVLPVSWLGAPDWQRWLRQVPVQAW